VLNPQIYNEWLEFAFAKDELLELSSAQTDELARLPNFTRRFLAISVRQLMSVHASAKMILDVIEWMYPWVSFDDDSQSHAFSYPSVCRRLRVDPYLFQQLTLIKLQELADAREPSRMDIEHPVEGSFEWRIAQILSPDRFLQATLVAETFPAHNPQSEFPWPGFDVPVTENTFSLSEENLFRQFRAEVDGALDDVLDLMQSAV